VNPVAAWWNAKRHGTAVPRDPEAAVRRALVAVLDQDLERAETLLSSVVRADSKELELYLALARLFRQRGEIGRAIHVHQNLLLRRDGTPELRFEALLGLADDFRAGGFLRRAIAAYEEALRERPDHPRTLRALVTLFVDAREPQHALPLARRLARAEGSEPSVLEARLWSQVAELERLEGHGVAARKALRRALRRDPHCVRAWIALGEVEFERGRPKRALAAWRRVPELDRRAGARVYSRIGPAFTAAGRPDAFEPWLRELLATRPDDLEARIALARALAERGATEDSIAELRAALEREPEALAAHVALGRLLRTENRSAEAAKAHEELLVVLEQRGDLARAADAEEAFA
jgi:lipopolysaccharide biosynthesis regulator YciM